MSNKFTPPSYYASIHPFNRKKEWRNGRRIYKDVCPTIVANEFRSVGNVIWEVYEKNEISTDVR